MCSGRLMTKEKWSSIHDDLRNGLFRRGDRLLLVSERARTVGAGNHAVHRVFSERVMAVKGSVEPGCTTLVETVPPPPCAIRYGTPGVDRTTLDRATQGGRSEPRLFVRVYVGACR